MDIPEYYRKFQTQKSDQPSETKKPEVTQENQPVQGQPSASDQQKKTQSAQQSKDITIPYKANSFTINQLEDWDDKTIYTLNGPVTDGIQHNLIISVDKEPAYSDLIEYAERHIKSIENDLKGCMLLKKAKTKLTNGTDAYEAIFSWYPTDQLKIYQHQIFAFIDNTVYKMTASFTKKTIKTLGPAVERMMLSLNAEKK